MNERIRKLAEQAKKYALDVMIKITDKEQALKVYSASYDTKFAELIVAECIDTVSDCSVEYCTRPQIVSEIKQHFGVES